MWNKIVENAGKLGVVFGVLLPLWGGAAFLYTYEKNLVKHSDFDLATVQTKQEAGVEDLDARIERTEILVAVYSLHTTDLSENEKNEYDRAKARLIHLENQRNQMVKVEP